MCFFFTVKIVEFFPVFGLTVYVKRYDCMDNASKLQPCTLTHTRPVAMGGIWGQCPPNCVVTKKFVLNIYR